MRRVAGESSVFRKRDSGRGRVTGEVSVLKERRERVETLESREVREEMREAGEWGKMIIFGVWKRRFFMMR